MRSKNFTVKAKPVVGEDGRVIRFDHKAEGITILPENHLLVIHDDDKVVGKKGSDFYRPLNTFFYSVLELK